MPGLVNLRSFGCFDVMVCDVNLCETSCAGKPLGFTLSAAEWDELVEELNLGDEDVEFQDAWDFLQSVQAKNGFTASEQQELIEAFGRFSTVSGNVLLRYAVICRSGRVREKVCCETLCETCFSLGGELENLKVKDLLTYLGFETTVDDVQDMVSRVDFNGSKTMDQNEFLRLMRLQREITIASYTAAYSRNRLFAHGGAPPEEIERVLALAKLHPNVHIMAQALEVVEESGDYDHSTQSLQFEGFLKVADYCRKTIPVYNRRHAHFQLNQIDELRKSFNSQDMESKGFISIGSFLGLLADTTLAVNTVAGRARMPPTYLLPRRPFNIL